MGSSKETHKYDDIINLPHHVSTKHAQMSMLNRAAQFSPFAALTGYDAAVKETARITDRRIELDDAEKEFISDQIQLIVERLPELTRVKITHFKADEKKDGGVYLSEMETVKKLDLYERIMIMESGKKIQIDDILSLEIIAATVEQS